MKTLLVALLLSASVYGNPQKGDRWNQLMNLINQEMKILNSTKRKRADLQYRLLELHSEKLKLIHERNNREFMEKARKAGVGKKEAHFAETRAYYKKTRDFGHGILKTWPRTNLRPQILFALALNSRDYGKDKITEKYLLEAISLIKDPHHSLRHHAETSLADFYYNEKRYQDAVAYYKRVIKKTEDEWLPKHLFNLSWCYLKTREFDLAINTIQEAYFKSKDRAYVNIKDQVLNNIGSFYVYAGRPMEGLEFYLKHEENSIPYLLPMAAKAADKGHRKETQAILDAAQKLVNKLDLIDHQEEVHHAYLDFYRQYSLFQEHEKIARDLRGYYNKVAKKPELKWPVEMKDGAIEKLRSLAGFLQIKLAKDMKKDGGHYEHQELDLVLKYFDHLIDLDGEKKVEYYYYRAETYYSVRRFEDAAPSYVEAITEAKRVKNEELARKSLNSMLALTGMEVLEKELNKKFLIFAYSEHIGLWPRDDKSEKIYPKLFEIYREAKDDENATQVITAFHKHYPEHLKEQQTFMTMILDQFIETKNTVKLAYAIEAMKKGLLSFPKVTIEKTELVLGNILFLQYQQMAKKGKRVEAAEGFESIFVHKLYPDLVKWQAAFFAAMTYLEMGDTVKSYYWQELAHARMTEEEKLLKREEQLKMLERTYRLQDFTTAHKLANFLLTKYCLKKDKTQTRFYEIAVMTALVEEKPASAQGVIAKSSTCLESNDTKETALAQIYKYHENQGDFFGLRRFVQTHAREPYTTQYRYTLQKWYWEKSSANLKEHIRREFKSIKHKDTRNWLKEIALYELARKDLELIQNASIWSLPVFDGDAYNKSLENYLIRLQSFRDKYQGLMGSSQVDLAILVTRIFSEAYQHVGESISGVRPQGMDEAIRPSFEKAMKQLSVQFFTASKKYDKQLHQALKKQETLTWGARSIASVEQVENPVFSFFTGLTMDKSKE